MYRLTLPYKPLTVITFLHLDTFFSPGIVLSLDVVGDVVGNQLSSFALKLKWINDLKVRLKYRKHKQK